VVVEEPLLRIIAVASVAENKAKEEVEEDGDACNKRLWFRIIRAFGVGGLLAVVV
jgi:hypothetical protein